MSMRNSLLPVRCGWSHSEARPLSLRPYHFVFLRRFSNRSPVDGRAHRKSIDTSPLFSCGRKLICHVQFTRTRHTHSTFSYTHSLKHTHAHTSNLLHTQTSTHTHSHFQHPQERIHSHTQTSMQTLSHTRIHTQSYTHIRTHSNNDIRNL